MKFSPPGLPCNCDNLSPCTNSYCKSFSRDWEALGYENGIYDKPPPYYANYAPCCYEIEISGISGSGTICDNCEDLNRIYYGGRLSLVSGSVQFLYTLYGLDAFGVCTNDYYAEVVQGYANLGLYHPQSGIDCRNLEFDLNFDIKDVPRYCDYSNIGGHVRGLYTPTECRTGWLYAGNLFENCIYSSSITLDLPVNECVSVSGNTACYISNDCGITSCVALSGFASTYMGVRIPSFSLSGVTGYDDDLDITSDTSQTCRKCGQLNRVWHNGDSLPECCECSDSMCLTGWNISLTYPSSYISLFSTHGVAAYWSSNTPSGVCPTSPIHFNFSSGNNSVWNRCDFTESAIDLDVLYNDYETSDIACGSLTNILESPCLSLPSDGKSVYIGTTGKPRSVIVDIPDNFDGPKVCAPDPATSGMTNKLYNCGDSYSYTSPIPPFLSYSGVAFCVCQTKPYAGTYSCQLPIREGGDYTYGFSDCPGYFGNGNESCISNISPCLSGTYQCNDCVYTFTFEDIFGDNLTGCTDMLNICQPGSITCPDGQHQTCLENWLCLNTIGSTNCTPHGYIQVRFDTISAPANHVRLLVTEALSISCPQNPFPYTAFGPYTWSKTWYLDIEPERVEYGDCGDYYYRIPADIYTLTESRPTTCADYNHYWPYQFAGATITVEIE